jgi:hypothetical protein
MVIWYFKAVDVHHYFIILFCRSIRAIFQNSSHLRRKDYWNITACRPFLLLLHLHFSMNSMVINEQWYLNYTFYHNLTSTKLWIVDTSVRRVWRYQRGNQNPYIEEEQITQRPKEKVRKDKQRSTKHTHTTKDRVTRTPLKTGVNSGAPIAPIVAHFCVGVEINFQVD